MTQRRRIAVLMGGACLFSFLLLVLCVLFVPAAHQLAQRILFRFHRPEVHVVERPVADARIVVEKSKRRLTLYSGNETVQSYRIGLGFAPEGDKLRKGDGRTPEGEFHVCTKDPRSRLYLALGLSYPNAEDAERGLHDGLISRTEHDAIVRAIERRRQPPWDTPLGGAIMIHGLGSRSDWTWGCVALDNDDARELFEKVPLGTTVTIVR